LKKQEHTSRGDYSDQDYCPEEVLKLVEELIKKTPNKKKVQTLTASLGIHYCEDSTNQIKALLNALNTKYLGQRKWS
jgi:hypothetical protein